MGKKNGKAKQETETFDTGMIPPPCRKLTPERAKEWLQSDFKEWQALENRCVQGGEDAMWLRDSIGYMVAACTHAMESGHAVRLEAAELRIRKGFSRGWFSMKTPLEYLAAALRAPMDQEWEFNEMRGALLAMIADLLKATERGIEAEERRRNEVASKGRGDEPTPTELEELKADREALEAELDAAIDAVSKPWDEKIQALKERELEIKRYVVERYSPSDSDSAADLLNRALLVSEIERHDKERQGAAERA